MFAMGWDSSFILNSSVSHQYYVLTSVFSLTLLPPHLDRVLQRAEKLMNLSLLHIGCCLGLLQPAKHHKIVSIWKVKVAYIYQSQRMQALHAKQRGIAVILKH